MRPTKLTVLLVVLILKSGAAAPTGYLDYLCKSVQSCAGMDGDGWYQMGDRCVKAFTEPLSFDDAEAACSQHKSHNNFTGHLVSIHNFPELDQVVCAMYKVSPERPEYWIGLRLALRYEDYMVYDWSDSSDLDFFYFSYDEPGDYECIGTNYNGWGAWNDIDCKALRPYVCAVKV